MIRAGIRASRPLRGRANSGLWNGIETRKALLILCGESKIHRTRTARTTWGLEPQPTPRFRPLAASLELQVDLLPEGVATVSIDVEALRGRLGPVIRGEQPGSVPLHAGEARRPLNGGPDRAFVHDATGVRDGDSIRHDGVTVLVEDVSSEWIPDVRSARLRLGHAALGQERETRQAERACPARLPHFHGQPSGGSPSSFGQQKQLARA